MKHFWVIGRMKRSVIDHPIDQCETLQPSLSVFIGLNVFTDLVTYVFWTCFSR
jgi:hypothetical protein